MSVSTPSTTPIACHRSSPFSIRSSSTRAQGSVKTRAAVSKLTLGAIRDTVGWSHLPVCDARHVYVYPPSHQCAGAGPTIRLLRQNDHDRGFTMTGLQKALGHEQARPFEERKESQTGFPFRKIVYVGDLSGEPSYGLRYTQKLVHERHAE